MAIRSPSSSASSIECVVSNIILPFFIFFINCQVKRIEYGSIPLVGSSRIITCNKHKSKTRINKDNFQNQEILTVPGTFFTPYYFLSMQFQEIISSSYHQKVPPQQCAVYLLNQPDHKSRNKICNHHTRLQRERDLLDFKIEQRSIRFIYYFGI